jgi:hypothetical protein
MKPKEFFMFDSVANRVLFNCTLKGNLNGVMFFINPIF